MAVSNDFGDFMDDSDHGDEGGYLHCRTLWPAERKGEGDQRVGGEMGDPVHGARECMASGWYAADSEEAKRQQHGGNAGESSAKRQSCCVQWNVL